MLHGENDCYWHHRIRTLFAEAGIATRRIQRMQEHAIWQCWLTRVSLDPNSVPKLAIRQLRKILRDGGLKVANGEFNIIDRRGDKLRVVFMLDIGSSGTVYRRATPGGNGELWAEIH